MIGAFPGGVSFLHKNNFNGFLNYFGFEEIQKIKLHFNLNFVVIIVVTCFIFV